MKRLFSLENFLLRYICVMNSYSLPRYRGKYEWHKITVIFQIFFILLYICFIFVLFLLLRILTRRMLFELNKYVYLEIIFSLERKIMKMNFRICIFLSKLCLVFQEKYNTRVFILYFSWKTEYAHMLKLMLHLK